MWRTALLINSCGGGGDGDGELEASTQSGMERHLLGGSKVGYGMVGLGIEGYWYYRVYGGRVDARVEGQRDTNSNVELLSAIAMRLAH